MSARLAAHFVQEETLEVDCRALHRVIFGISDIGLGLVLADVCSGCQFATQTNRGRVVDHSLMSGRRGEKPEIVVIGMYRFLPPNYTKDLNRVIDRLSEVEITRRVLNPIVRGDIVAPVVAGDKHGSRQKNTRVRVANSFDFDSATRELKDRAISIRFNLSDRSTRYPRQNSIMRGYASVIEELCIKQRSAWIAQYPKNTIFELAKIKHESALNYSVFAPLWRTVPDENTTSNTSGDHA